MKRSFLSALGIFCFLLLSCEQEEISTNNTNNNDSIPALIDSSQLEHNLEWNGHYYLLEFDSAYATFNHSRSSQGDSPEAMFYSFFSDKYTDQQAILMIHPYVNPYGNYSPYGYDPVATQELLPGCSTLLQHPMEQDDFVGFKVYLNDQKIIPAVCPQNCNNCGDYSIDVPLFDVYDFEGDLWVNYELSIIGRCLQLDLKGKLRAQS